MFNKIILIGNLTRDIEVRHSQSGTQIATTAIATNRKYKAQDGERKEEVMFVDLTFFGRTAEVASMYLHRGSKVMIEGRLKLDRWTDAAGNNRSKHEVVVDAMKMLDTRKDAMERKGEGTETIAGSRDFDVPSLSEGAREVGRMKEGDYPF